MDRIKELLAKGIENLTDDELAEFETLCMEEADALLDGGDDSDEALEALEEIAGYLDQHKTEVKAREGAKAARAEKAKALRDRIMGADDAADDGGDDGEPAAEDAATVEDGDVLEVEVKDGEPVPAAAAADTDPAAAPAAVAAASAPVPVVTRVAARRPDRAAPRAQARQAALVASANVPGITAGARLDSGDKLARAIEQAWTSARTYRGQGALKMPVASLSVEFPEDRFLDSNALGNERKIKAAAGMQALAASGGICKPLPITYDLPTVGTDARPVRDGLPRFGADDGGIRTLAGIPTIDDVHGAVGEWTHANDENPSDPTTKPYLTIPCSSDEDETYLNAITRSVKFGNFRQRYFAAQIDAYMRTIGVWQARFAEAKLLKAISTGSTNVTHGSVLGTSRDVIAALHQIIAGERFRHRLPDTAPIRVILPRWLRQNIIVDLIRTDLGGGTLEERLARAESSVTAFFAGLNANVTWHLDYEYGVAVGSPGGPFGGAQGVGPVIGWPSKVRAYVFPEGDWLFLDGGSLDLGVVRDATLVGTNDLLMFAETYENVHHHGVGGSFTYDIDICANGGYASPIDVDVCVSGS